MCHYFAKRERRRQPYGMPESGGLEAYVCPQFGYIVTQSYPPMRHSLGHRRRDLRQFAIGGQSKHRAQLPGNGFELMPNRSPHRVNKIAFLGPLEQAVTFGDFLNSTYS